MLLIRDSGKLVLTPPVRSTPEERTLGAEDDETVLADGTRIDLSRTERDGEVKFTIRQFDLTPQDIQNGVVGSVIFEKTVGDVTVESWIEVEFVLRKTYPAGTLLEVYRLLDELDTSPAPDPDLAFAPSAAYLGSATVTAAGNRAVAQIPNPSGAYYVKEPWELAAAENSKGKLPYTGATFGLKKLFTGGV